MINKQVAEFLGSILMSHVSPLKQFEEKIKNFEFDGENEKVWQFIILKSFDEKFLHLIPLAKHLIENQYCKLDENITTYATLVGYKIELATKGLKSVENDINQTMSSFHFTEKIKITNDAIDNLYDLANKIIQFSEVENIEKAKNFLEKYNIDTNQIHILPKTKKNNVKLS
jgi:hypothetical protein